MSNQKIIDAHCHISSTRFIPASFLEGVAKNILSRAGAIDMTVDSVVRLLQKQNQDHDGSGLIKEMDQAGIDKAVVLLPDFTFVMKTELSIEEMIKEHVEIKRRHKDRIFLFYGVDPRWGQDGLNLFERCVREHGIDGLKLYPPCGYSPSDESLFPYYEICADIGCPVLLHTGPTTPTLRFDFAHPDLIDKAAFNFPNLNFILAHGGVNNCQEAVQLCNYRHNVYLDVAGFASTLSNDGWINHLRRIFSLGINKKILFGTDWPLFKMQGGQKKVISEFMDPDKGPFSNTKENDIQDVMHKNISKLLMRNRQTEH